LGSNCPIDWVEAVGSVQKVALSRDFDPERAPAGAVRSLAHIQEWLRCALVARSGTNQRLDSAPWFDVGTGIRARGLLWQLADRKRSFLMSSAAAGMRLSWP
jgi:hypothetical protein